jgi:hypothetical protein
LRDEGVRGAPRAASGKGAQRSKDPLDERVTQQQLSGGPPLRGVSQPRRPPPEEEGGVKTDRD